MAQDPEMHAKATFGARHVRTRPRRRRGGRLLTTALLGVVAVVVLGLSGASGAASLPRSQRAPSPTTARSKSSGPTKGGSLTVLEGTGFAGDWPGLDPATDTDGAANQSYMEAIYGELFELGQNGKLIYDLATGYKFSNGGKTVNITLRKGVKFSNGARFDASAVVWNWKRDLASTCTCKPTFDQTTTPVITVTGSYSFSITFTYVDASFIAALQDDILNWIASPTAYMKMGETKFALKPVGAGPFVVVSDTPSAELILERNPNYWDKSEPYLNKLIFETTADDESAYEVMLAGDAQAYEGLSTPALVSSEKKHFTVTTEPSTSPYDIQLNTSIAPFNNILAREAIYYATDAPLLDKKLFNDTTPVGESFEAPAGLFYEKTVPGYITYNLAMAKKLVKESGLNKITLNFFTITAPVAIELMEAIQQEWEAAGMHVTIANYDLSTLISEFTGGKWESALQTAGAYDPATGVGVAFRFASTSPFSGVHSTYLDTLLEDASAVVNPKTRAHYYDLAAAYIAKEAYGPFLFPINDYDVAIKDAHGVGLTEPVPAVAVDPEVLWETVYRTK